MHHAGAWSLELGLLLLARNVLVDYVIRDQRVHEKTGPCHKACASGSVLARPA